MGLAFERMGSGPPLVLLHGIGHHRQAWNAVTGLLTPRRARTPPPSARPAAR
jgi:hypothetical protein